MDIKLLKNQISQIQLVSYMEISYLLFEISIKIYFGKRNEELYFWRTHAGAEIDLFWQSRGKNWGAEFKYVDAPRMTKSMQVAIKDLNLENLWVVYPGREDYKLAENITVLPLFKIPAIWQYTNWIELDKTDKLM